MRTRNMLEVKAAASGAKDKVEFVTSYINCPYSHRLEQIQGWYLISYYSVF